MKMPCNVVGWEHPLHRRPHPVMRTYKEFLMPQPLAYCYCAYQSPSAARGLRYRKWPFGMASEVFWRSGDAHKVLWCSGDCAGVGGFGRVPPHSKKRHPPKAGGDGRWSGALPRRSLSVCPLRGELVRGGWSDRDETFGGGRWQCQERLSPEPARLVEVQPKKGREIQIS